MTKSESDVVTVFLIVDAVSCAIAGESTPNGYYNLERMLLSLIEKGSRVGVCGSCMDARGIKPESIIPGAKRSSMEELPGWTREADKVLVF